MLLCLIKVIVIASFLNEVDSLPLQEESNLNANDNFFSTAFETQETLEFQENVLQKVGNVAKTLKVITEVKATSEHKHTPPPECHGERKEVDPAAAEEYKAKKHTRPIKASQTTVRPTTLFQKVPTASTGVTKKSTKRHGIKFDQNGDSIWEDDSNDSPDSSDAEVKKKQGKIDSEGNLIDAENQNSGERVQESEDESEESDGIPIITIPLVDILNKYARMMGGKRASNSRYEYSYEDENEIKIREIKDRILEEVDDNNGDEDVVDL